MEEEPGPRAREAGVSPAGAAPPPRSALPFPGQRAAHPLARVEHARLLGRLNHQLLALHLEESSLVAAGVDLVPGDVDRAGDLVALDREATSLELCKEILPRAPLPNPIRQCLPDAAWTARAMCVWQKVTQDRK